MRTRSPHCAPAPGVGHAASARNPLALARRMLSQQLVAKAPYALAWLLGIPIPVLLIVYLFTRAC